MTFADRHEAGRLLGERAKSQLGKLKNPLVLALPRGGVPVAYEVAKQLNAELELAITRKIGHPSNPEYAIGAVGEHGATVWNESEASIIDGAWLNLAVQKEQAEINRRRQTYGKNRPSPKIKRRDVVLVDDGVATGLTIIAAIKDVRQLKPHSLSLAIPVAPAEVMEGIKNQVDNLVILHAPTFYRGSVGAYYEKFGQTSDEEVMELLDASKQQ